MMTERSPHSPEKMPLEDRIAALEEKLAVLEEAQRSQQEEVVGARREYKEFREAVYCEECKLPRGGFLSDRDIIRLIREGRIVVDPLPDLDSAVGTCKIDLRLGGKAREIMPLSVRNLDLGAPLPPEYYRTFEIDRMMELNIPFGVLVIAGTLEKLTLPNDMMGIMVGKSGHARRGLKVEGASVFDPGWDGVPALELQNSSHIGLTAHYGQAICAMIFAHLTSPARQGYAEDERSTYKNQDEDRL